jgi:hypothetical protein
LTNGRNLAHNGKVLMTHPAFSVVIPQYWLAMGGKLCVEAIA